MELPFQTVDKETYDRDRAIRIKSAALGVGTICVMRQLTGRATADYAIDANIRIDKMGEPNEQGRRLIEIVVLDDDLRDFKKDGKTLHGQSLLGRDGVIYEFDGTEDGYFPGATDPWDMSRLENLAAPDVLELDPSRQLISV